MNKDICDSDYLSRFAFRFEEFDYDYFSVEDGEYSAGILLWQACRAWQLRMDKILKSHPDFCEQFIIMSVLAWCNEEKHDVSQESLVLISKLGSSALKHINRLVEIEAIVYESNYLLLTEQGRELLSNLKKLVDGVDDEFFNTVLDVEKEDLARIAGRLLYDIAE